MRQRPHHYRHPLGLVPDLQPAAHHPGTPLQVHRHFRLVSAGYDRRKHERFTLQVERADVNHMSCANVCQLAGSFLFRAPLTALVVAYLEGNRPFDAISCYYDASVALCRACACVLVAGVGNLEADASGARPCLCALGLG